MPAFFKYDGTLRVEKLPIGSRASGDLYYRPLDFGPFFPPGQPPRPRATAPNPMNGIPIFKRKNYTYYLRVTAVIGYYIFSFKQTITLKFEKWRYNQTDPGPEWHFFEDQMEGSYTAEMSYVPGGASWPEPSSYLEGDVINDQTGAAVERLRMGWVSPYLRHITVEIDTVAGAKPPMTTDDGRGWQDILGHANIKVDVRLSDSNISEGQTQKSDGWDATQLHSRMITSRDSSVDLDREWLFYILVVSKLDPNFLMLGLMFDSDTGDDPNKTPREGLAMISQWPIGNNPRWGYPPGTLFQDAKDPFMRTAVHELGHAMGLDHPENYVPPNPAEPFDRTLMCTTGSVVQETASGLRFPKNIIWQYSEKNLMRLRHWSDVMVRPGGKPFHSAPNKLPNDVRDAVEFPGLQLTLKPQHSEVPIGAPVRVKVTLTNLTESPVPVPSDLELDSSNISGAVKDRTIGTSRTFASPTRVVRYHCPKVTLKPKESVSAVITLLHGTRGALFPQAGVAEIQVQAAWSLDEGPHVVVRGYTTVLVTGIESPSHAAAAHCILTTPETQKVLVLGDVGLPKAVEALRLASEDNTLGRHFETS